MTTVIERASIFSVYPIGGFYFREYGNLFHRLYLWFQVLLIVRRVHIFQNFLARNSSMVSQNVFVSPSFNNVFLARQCSRRGANFKLTVGDNDRIELAGKARLILSEGTFQC